MLTRYNDYHKFVGLFLPYRYLRILHAMTSNAILFNKLKKEQGLVSQKATNKHFPLFIACLPHANPKDYSHSTAATITSTHQIQ